MYIIIYVIIYYDFIYATYIYCYSFDSGHRGTL